jgi:hypothetical protein
LTSRKGLTPAQIRTAVRFAELASPGAADAGLLDMEGLIERQLRNADLALGNRAMDGARQQAATRYNPTLLNVSSRFEIPRMVQALKARAHGSLCFYGPPGTGKTALAEHIAQALEQPLLIKQASDLMSKASSRGLSVVEAVEALRSVGYSESNQLSPMARQTEPRWRAWVVSPRRVSTRTRRRTPPNEVVKATCSLEVATQGATRWRHVSCRCACNALSKHIVPSHGENVWAA